MGAEFLGMAKVPVKDFIDGQEYDQWLDLVDRTGQPVMYSDKATKGTRQSRLHITIKYRPVGTQVSCREEGLLAYRYSSRGLTINLRHTQ